MTKQTKKKKPEYRGIEARAYTNATEANGIKKAIRADVKSGMVSRIHFLNALIATPRSSFKSYTEVAGEPHGTIVRYNAVVADFKKTGKERKYKLVKDKDGKLAEAK